MLKTHCEETFHYRSMTPKHIYLYLCAVFLSFEASSQGLEIDDIKFVSKTYWGFSISPLLMSKTKIEGDRRKYNLSSNPQFGAEALVNYYYKFSRNYSLVVSGGGAVLGYNFNFDIDGNMFEPPTGTNIFYNGAVARSLDIFYFRGQSEIQRQFYHKIHSNWFVASGLSILYTVGKSEEISYYLTNPDYSEQKYLTRSQVNNNHGKPWFNVHFIGGHNWQTGSGNAFQIAFI
jgi:hypothetical protein